MSKAFGGVNYACEMPEYFTDGNGKHEVIRIIYGGNDSGTHFCIGLADMGDNSTRLVARWNNGGNKKCGFPANEWFALPDKKDSKQNIVFSDLNVLIMSLIDFKGGKI